MLSTKVDPDTRFVLVMSLYQNPEFFLYSISLEASLMKEYIVIVCIGKWLFTTTFILKA